MVITCNSKERNDSGRVSLHLICQGGYEDVEVGSEIFRHPKGGSEKIVGLGGGWGGAPKICILQIQKEGRESF